MFDTILNVFKYKKCSLRKTESENRKQICLKNTKKLSHKKNFIFIRVQRRHIYSVFDTILTCLNAPPPKKKDIGNIKLMQNWIKNSGVRFKDLPSKVSFDCNARSTFSYARVTLLYFTACLTLF